MSKTKELVAAGHALAKELHCAESAALVRELATQLDCAFAATRTACGERTAAHSTIEKAREVTNCPQGVDLQWWVGQLVSGLSAISSENEALKFSKPTLSTMMDALDAFYADDEVPERAMMAAYEILRESVRTPATDSILRAAEARGVENLRDTYRRLAKSCEAFGKVEDSVFHDAVVDACDQWLREGKAE